MDARNTSFSFIVRRSACVVLPAAALPAVVFAAPTLNPFWLPHIDLTGPLALLAYWIAESAGTRGIPVIALTMTALVVGRSGISWAQRGIEGLVIVIAIAALLGGGAYANEHIIKPAFAVTRPDIVELAENPPEAPLLRISAKEFYALPDKASRSDYLRRVLTPDVHFLDEHVRNHWISETGYSFPSGHSFSSMMFATFFLAMGLAYFSGHRRWIFYLLVPWAVAVCFSRPVLRVHYPTDVCAGCVEGIVTGILAFVLARSVLAVLLRERAVWPEPAPEPAAGSLPA